jgi:folylpolyglutamate synthase/dihydropteroate synthase
MSALASWLARQERSHPNAIDLGLARVREVADRQVACHYAENFLTA